MTVSWFYLVDVRSVLDLYRHRDHVLATTPFEMLSQKEMPPSSTRKVCIAKQFL